MDLNSNGSIDNGTELYGDATWSATANGLAANGFEALAQYDWPTQGGNNDGVIDANDQVWGELLLWQDANADAMPTSDEISSLAGSVINSISLDVRENNAHDGSGSLLPFWSWAHGLKKNGEEGKFKVADPPAMFRPRK